MLPKFRFRHSIMKYVQKLAGLFNRLCGAISKPGCLKLHYTETVTHITAFPPYKQGED